MDAPNIKMLTEIQLKELLDIRSQMTALQARYDEIVNASTGSAQAATVSVSPAQLPPSATTASTPAPAAPAAAAPRPVMPPTPKAEEAAPVKVDGSVTASVRQTLVKILTDAAKPLPFNTIYSKLEASGTPLPEAKPMLVIRKILRDPSLFEVAKGGMFQIKTDAAAVEATPAPAPASPAPAAAPAPAPAATPVSPTPAVAPAPAAAATPVALAAPAAPVAPTPVSPAPVPPTPAAMPTPVAVTPVDPSKPAASFSTRLDAILNQ